MRFTFTADYPAAAPVKVFVSALTLSLALTGYGCGADRGPGTPISPSPTVPAAPLPPGPDRNSQGELWGLTTAIVSREGSACFWPHPVGKTFDWTLSVERNGAQARFVYDVNNPHDNSLFVGEVHEQSFTAVTGTVPKRLVLRRRRDDLIVRCREVFIGWSYVIWAGADDISTGQRQRVDCHIGLERRAPLRLCGAHHQHRGGPRWRAFAALAQLPDRCSRIAVRQPIVGRERRKIEGRALLPWRRAPTSKT